MDNDEVVRDTDADTSDVIEETADASNDIVEDTDADTRDVMSKLDEVLSAIDRISTAMEALASATAKASAMGNGDSSTKVADPEPHTMKTIEELNLD